MLIFQFKIYFYTNNTPHIPIKRIIRKNSGLITIHSHPSSFPLSIEDFNANYQYNYYIGIV